MKLLVIALLCGSVLVSGCEPGKSCSGPVQRQQLLSPTEIKLTVHNNTKTGKDATFCYVTGSREKLAGCVAGGPFYPRCSK